MNVSEQKHLPAFQNREEAHNKGTAGARYTRMRRPVKIVYFEAFVNRSDAMKIEYELKQLSKKD